MKTPHDISAAVLINKLAKFGYYISGQKGSHIRLTRKTDLNVHHITIPNHDPLKIGTLNNIINDLADQLKISKEEIIRIIS
jgi:predicted RNA binding protein YcfA (HicA-like mRNA interferase family)